MIVRIVDRGPGIPPAQLERVFEPSTGPARRRAGIAGPAWGWPSRAASCEANGGRLHVESLPGQGATFIFDLPIDPRPTPPTTTSRSGAGSGGVIASGAAARAAAPPRVLVCDDEPQILRALKVILREAGFEVVPAETASEALDRAAVRPPEAAIIDLVLPDGDGIEVTRRLREWSQMPILVLSAMGDEDAKVRALEAGADDYVTKPFGSRELVARLQAALRRAAPGEDEPVVVSDGLEVDLAARSVRRDGRASTSRRSSSTCCARSCATAGG